jgi:hypothetical protein
MIEKFIGKSGKLVSHKITKITEEEIYHIEKQSREIDDRNPTITQRIKFIRYKPNKLYCDCSKPLSFSASSYEVFRKTCGDACCAARSYDKNKAIERFKDTERNKDKTAITHYTIEQLIIYAKDFIKKDIKASHFASDHEDICFYIKQDAKDRKMKLSQYLFHLIHMNGDFNLPNTKFLSFEKGYKVPPKWSTKEDNKVNDMMSLFDEVQYKVIDFGPVNKTSWTIECEKCQEVFSRWLNNGREPKEIMCPKCYPRSKSKMEYDIIEEIKKSYTGEIIHTFYLENTKYKNGIKSVDIFLPEKNLAIELNGIFFHKDEKNRHIEKKQYCEDLGIDLLQFTDYDYENKKDIVMSMVKNKIGINNKIYARKCRIQEINTEEYKRFLEENHIKGYASAKIKLGAYYKDELVSVFSLSKSRFNHKETELVRFCSILNTTVVGIFSKFISYVKKHNYTKEIITFADLHYGNGKSYEKIGFERLYDTKPSYYYYKNGKIYNRIHFQKHKLQKLLPEYFDSNKTEKEIMKEAKYLRYYDCGNRKFSIQL